MVVATTRTTSQTRVAETSSDANEALTRTTLAETRGGERLLLLPRKEVSAKQTMKKDRQAINFLGPQITYCLNIALLTLPTREAAKAESLNLQGTGR